MKISFDLDDTLIPASEYEFDTEKQTLFQKIFGVELIRKGTQKLFKELQENHHKVGIYTTSYRSKFRIRFHLMTYGIYPNFIINESSNRLELKSRNTNSSKYPPAFGIDLHVDDSKGVQIEGNKYNFRTVIVEKEDLKWAKRIKEYIYTNNH